MDMRNAYNLGDHTISTGSSPLHHTFNMCLGIPFKIFVQIEKYIENFLLYNQNGFSKFLLVEIRLPA